MIRKVATMIGPGSRRSLIRMAGLVYELSSKRQASSGERSEPQATNNMRQYVQFKKIKKKFIIGEINKKEK
jgi:hypothetical protein